jgi:hypothetical protein
MRVEPDDITARSLSRDRVSTAARKAWIGSEKLKTSSIQDPWMPLR